MRHVIERVYLVEQVNALVNAADSRIQRPDDYVHCALQHTHDSFAGSGDAGLDPTKQAFANVHHGVLDALQVLPQSLCKPLDVLPDRGSQSSCAAGNPVNYRTAQVFQASHPLDCKLCQRPGHGSDLAPDRFGESGDA